MENQYQALSFVAAAIIAQELLKVSKAGIPAESSESYEHKVTKTSFGTRVHAVHNSLASRGGPTEAAAAKLIHSHGFYTDMAVGTALAVINTTIEKLKAGEKLLNASDYGDFIFAPYVPHDADDDGAEENGEDEENEEDTE